MSAAANSGEILQRGISSCSEAADGDILPPKIFGSKSLTRGGGELHVDATGHFMRRFRNVLFKLSREYSGSSPEYDRIELEPVEDSLLHLAFLYAAVGDREIKVHLADTWMMGQEVTPQASFKLGDIEGEHVERVAEYKLTKGRHYSLTVYYVGGTQSDEHGRNLCALYDLTLSISHLAKIAEQAECRAGGQIESLAAGLSHVITDRDLDREGAYAFDKVLKLQYPEDFKKVAKITEHGKTADILVESVGIDLSSNFDIRATLDFEFDEALFTLGFTESARDESGEWYTDVSHEQSGLVFKQNNDHYKTVRRELVADGVESQERSRKHTLTIANRQPDLLVLVGAARSSSCLYVRVKISIQATQRSAQSLYSSSSS